MTEIQNSKQLALILFEIWILSFGNYLSFGACNLLFPGLSGLGLCSSNFGIDNCPAGATFSEHNLGKNLAV